MYLICIGPYSIARWLFFYRIKVKYQITLVVTTFFSLSGLFNTALFFLTRPNLVTGHEDTPPLAPGIDVQTQPFRDKELISFSSQKFGSLPTRNPTASNYASPEGADTNLRASPGLMEYDWGSHTPHVPGKRSYGDLRSMPASPIVEEQIMDTFRSRPVL